MGNSQNEEIARRGLDMFSTGDTSAVSELVADGAANHDPAQPEEASGPEGFAQVVQMYRGMFPDLHMTVEHQFADGDYVCSRWSCEGTHEETGKHVTVTGISIDKIQDGKVTESWTQWDNAGMMQQLGAMEPSGAATG
ncbi:MAG: ester cyclase [Actinobacteria bacterium]|nr:ester cyclase [Actinomycetota bacterium]